MFDPAIIVILFIILLSLTWSGIIATREYAEVLTYLKTLQNEMEELRQELNNSTSDIDSKARDELLNIRTFLGKEVEIHPKEEESFKAVAVKCGIQEIYEVNEDGDAVCTSTLFIVTDSDEVIDLNTATVLPKKTGINTAYKRILTDPFNSINEDWVEEVSEVSYLEDDSPAISDMKEGDLTLYIEGDECYIRRVSVEMIEFYGTHEIIPRAQWYKVKAEHVEDVKKALDAYAR